MEQISPHVSQGTTLIFTLILVAMIVSLALEEKIHAKKSLIVSVFAVIALVLATALNLLPFGQITLANGHEIRAARS